MNVKEEEPMVHVGPNSAKLMDFIVSLHEKGEWRPTVVVLLQTLAGEFGIGRQNNSEENWAPIQGGIKKGESPLGAGFREIREEGGFPEYLISFVTPLLRMGCLPFAPGQSLKGFTQGKFYFCFGMRLTPTQPVSSEGDGAILEWRWMDADEACHYCTRQPQVGNATEATRRKGWHILEPAIRMMDAIPKKFH